MNTAERIIKPTQPGIFRTIFLYTGQGESTLLVIPTGPAVDNYIYVLVDTDKDNETNEIDILRMLKDLFVSTGKLGTFINTHPHNDHIGGIKDIYDEIGFDEIWHSNHKPGGKHKEKYEDLKYVIDKIGKQKEFHLFGTNELNKVRSTSNVGIIKPLGLIAFQVLSPAEHLCEDINDGDADERNKRIHEQCGVIKFTYGIEPKSILITGDSDRVAWEDNITNYHGDVLKSSILSASHHGSRTFFKHDKNDDAPYEEHLRKINPDYLIISAPKQSESPHGHPHDDAMQIYLKYIDKNNILHLGKNTESVIVDIDAFGNVEISTDKELIAEYGNNSNNRDENTKNIYIGSQTSRIDEKPMG